MVKFNLERWLRTGEELILNNGVKVLCTKYFEQNTGAYKLRSILADGNSISHYTNGDYTSVSEQGCDLYFANDIEPKPQPKRGDWVWVRDRAVDEWDKRRFIERFIKTNNSDVECRTVYVGQESRFFRGELYATTTWRHMRTTDPALDKDVVKLEINGKEVVLSEDSIKSIMNAVKGN